MHDILLSNSFCAVVIGVLILGTNLRREKKDKTARRFDVLMYSFLGFLATNIISELLEGNIKLEVLTFIINLLSFFAIDMLMISFARYVYYLIPDIRRSTAIEINIVIIINYLGIIIEAILACTGKLFIIENGCYVEKDFISIPYYVSALIMLIMIFIIVSNHKLFNTRRFIVILLYILIPIPSTITELYTSYYAIMPMALTISILLIYIFIQAATIEDGRDREVLLEEISSTDLLTNLPNRRAYYARLEELSKTINYGVVFCDMNGLKYTNDHYGHSAGDELIKKFAKIMTDRYGTKNVFRLSGDEFVAIVKDKYEDEFIKQFKAFQSTLEKNNNIAAAGYSFGSGSKIDALIADAESYMYKDKEAKKAGRDSQV